MTPNSQKENTWDFHIFFEKWAGHVSEQVSGQDFMQNWNLFGLRGDFPYCKRFVLAGTKREPSKQSLWEKTIEISMEQRVPSSVFHNPRSDTHIVGTIFAPFVS